MPFIDISLHYSYQPSLGRETRWQESERASHQQQEPLRYSIIKTKITVPGESGHTLLKYYVDVPPNRYLEIEGNLIESLSVFEACP